MHGDKPALEEPFDGAVRPVQRRFAALDIGSNSAQLRIADLVPGTAPEPVASV